MLEQKFERPIYLINKRDLILSKQLPNRLKIDDDFFEVHYISVKDDSVEEISNILKDKLHESYDSNPTLIISERQKLHL